MEKCLYTCTMRIIVLLIFTGFVSTFNVNICDEFKIIISTKKTRG